MYLLVLFVIYETYSGLDKQQAHKGIFLNYKKEKKSDTVEKNYYEWETNKRL